MRIHRVGKVIVSIVAILAAAFAAGFLSAGSACAHDPRFACSPRTGSDPILISDAEKSWAFYGHLGPGQSDSYVFTIAQPSKIPWSLLIDMRDELNASRPRAAIFDQGGAEVAKLDTLDQAFYEPFSREHYITTREAELSLAPGTYRLIVSMNGTQAQRYVLAIGKDERFSITEIPYVAGAISRIRDMRY